MHTINQVTTWNKHNPKYVSTHVCTPSTISDFKDELKNEISNLNLNNNLKNDPKHWRIL